ncbi:hypothetical protein GSI_09054 [Ganoderma sinense ZZ0214-1]|uniref:Transporter n=1 Tax=Ganoderma sinense ZZ0214-1 TaxID=1077348 RepID=A0A2G8S5I7_9APHY|nr:hypothetical protein GSI_09054 [Ganoderma sinense ZZ0214-1]
MHLIIFFVLLRILCAAAYPSPIGFPPALTDKDLGGPANVLEIPLLLAPTRVGEGDSSESNGHMGRVSPVVQGMLLNPLVNRAVALSALPTSTSLQVIIPPTPSRTSLYPQPTSAQLPTHTQPESTAEKTSSIPSTPHALSVSLSDVITPTATSDGDGTSDSGDSGSGSDPSIPTPTSTDSSSSSSSSKLGTILGSVFGIVIFIVMIVVFVIWWRRN